MASSRIPGCQIVIYRYKDDFLDKPQDYLKAFGHLDIEKKVPKITLIRLPLASSSKSFTSHSLVPILTENGFTLDTPIKAILPKISFGEKGRYLYTYDRSTKLG
ncbi:uncharacterized protein I206_105820 [Kwoniella pini CBS 10737]|uniref:Uncharacterized protein n=1 Tax=Kwoniella pini CBS 10737 TaxID=1296096 RepID=A0A1B9I084_9TREE|nr:uncharacterized protein I206_04640 [Kwoniella pini CBS 10737]OCF48953.1 hypothetical protein I206_04640 [Kwoniella pini CBS 10737]